MSFLVVLLRKIEGPGLPGGFCASTRETHLFSKKGTYAQASVSREEGNEDIELNLPSWGYSSRGLWFEDPLGIARQPTQPETAPDGPEGAESGASIVLKM